jgi:hypothetical protein
MNDFALVTVRTHPDGFLQLIDWRRAPGDTDIVLRAAGSTERITLDLVNGPYALGPIDCIAQADFIRRHPQAPAGARWTEAVKLSRVPNLELTLPECRGGTEDVIDEVDCRHVAVFARRFIPTGRYVSTIKGGCEDCQFHVQEQIGHGTVTDWDFGNWYDYNRRRTRGITVNSSTQDRSPITARILRADKPVIQGGAWKITKPWWRPLFLTVYPVYKGFSG